MDDQFQMQRVAYGNNVIHGEGWVRGCLRRFGQTKFYADTAVRGGHDFLHFPRFHSSKAMLPHSLAMPKPRKNDRNAATDRVVLIEPAALAEEKQGRLVPFLEMGDVRAVKVNADGAPRSDHFQHRQFPPAVHECDTSWRFARWLPLGFVFNHSSLAYPHRINLHRRIN